MLRRPLHIDILEGFENDTYFDVISKCQNRAVSNSGEFVSTNFIIHYVQPNSAKV